MKATDEAKQPDHAGVAFHPPLLLLASLGAGFLLRWLAPLSVSTSTVPAMIGPAIVALAFALFFWAVVTMLRGHASIPTNKPTDAIVAGGPFRLSRNPIYLSMIFLQIGVGAWTKRLWFFVLSAISDALLPWGVFLREARYIEQNCGDKCLWY